MSGALVCILMAAVDLLKIGSWTLQVFQNSLTTNESQFKETSDSFNNSSALSSLTQAQCGSRSSPLTTVTKETAQHAPAAGRVALTEDYI